MELAFKYYKKKKKLNPTFLVNPRLGDFLRRLFPLLYYNPLRKLYLNEFHKGPKPCPFHFLGFKTLKNFSIKIRVKEINNPKNKGKIFFSS